MFPFRDQMVFVTSVIGTHFLQVTSKSNWRKIKTFVMNKTTKTIFQVIILLQCSSVFKDSIQKKTLTVPRSYCTSTLRGFCVLRLLKVRKGPFSKSWFMDFTKAMASYMLAEDRLCQVRVLATRSESISPVSQRKTLVDVDGLFKGEEGPDTAVFERSRNRDDAPWYMMYLMVDRLHSLILC